MALSERTRRLAISVATLSARELAEFRAELIRLTGGDDPLEGTGVREPRRPHPPTLPDADAEDRSVRGRTL